jgi:hypothetical protein
MRVVRERECHAADARDRSDDLHRDAGSRHHVERAGAHLRQHRGIGTQLGVGEKLDIDASVRLFTDIGAGFFHRHRGRVGGLKLTADLEVYFRALREQRRALRGQEAADGRRSQLSSIDQHASLPG